MCEFALAAAAALADIGEAKPFVNARRFKRAKFGLRTGSTAVSQSDMPSSRAADVIGDGDTEGNAPDGTVPQRSGWLCVRDWPAAVSIQVFPLVLGLAGLSLAWSKAHQVIGVPLAVGDAILILSAVAFAVLIGLYAVKFVYCRGVVLSEFNHPVTMNFFPTISVALLLFSVGTTQRQMELAEGLFAVGAALHLILTLVIVNRWISREFEIIAFNPSWFFPAVGNIIAPIAGAKLGFVEVSWFFYSVGMTFWVVLFTVILYRIVFHAPLNTTLVPTLFMFIPPPAFGFMAYCALNGGIVDPVCKVLYYLSLFMTLLMLTRAGHFLKVPFAMTCWAYTFPLAAIATASLEYLRVTGLGMAFDLISCILLGTVTVVVAAVSLRTLQAAFAGQITASR